MVQGGKTAEIVRGSTPPGRVARQAVAVAASVALYLLPLGGARADEPQGAELFDNQCGTCHVVAPKAEPRQGPNLHGVLGRPAGKLKGFKYSPALAKAKFTWTRDKLDSWLADSTLLVPGSVMPYRQADAATRGRVIDYLAAAGAAKQ